MPPQAATVAHALSEQPHEIACLGRIVPGQGILRVSAPPQAIIRELRTRRGAHVQPGQIVAVLRDYDTAVAALREAEQQRSVAEAALAQAKAPDKPAVLAAQQAAIARQDAVMKNADDDYRRKEALYRDRLISTSDFDSAAVALKTSQESLRREREVLAGLGQVRDVDVLAAEKKLAAAAAACDRARTAVDQEVIRAPISGTVLEILAWPGEAVGAEQGVVQIGDTNHMYVEAEVYLNDIARVQMNAPASITGESFTGAITGKVGEILQQAGRSTVFPTDPQTAADQRVVKVRIQLDVPARVERLNGSQVSVRIRVP